MKRRLIRILILSAVIVISAVLFLPSANETPTPSKRPTSVKSRRIRLPGPRAQPFIASVGAPQIEIDDSRILEIAGDHLREEQRTRPMRSEHQLIGKVSRTPLGAVVRYDVFQDDLPIVGMRIEIHLDNQLRVNRTEWNYRPIDPVEIEGGGEALYASVTDRLPAGYRLRNDGTGFSEIIYELYQQKRAEHSVVVPVVNENGIAMSLILSAREATVLGSEMPRYEVDRRGRARPP